MVSSPRRPSNQGERAQREGDRDGYGASDVPDWRGIDWRSVSRAAIVAGRRVSYVDVGEGTPIVLVHGTGGCWQNWLENIAPLSVGHRVIVVDLPGFGDSEMPLAQISFEGFADAVLGLSEQLELGAPTLVGHSMGGIVALEAARRRPDEVGAVVMVGGTAVTILEFARRPWAALRTPNLAKAVAGEIAVGGRRSPSWLLRAAVSRPGLRRLSFWYVLDRPDWIAQDVLRELANGAGRRGYLPAVAAHRRYRLPGRVDLACPLLIVHGERDRLVSKRDLERFAATAPSAEVELISRAGHMPQLEMPRQFNQIVLGFLRRNETAAHSDEPSAVT